MTAFSTYNLSGRKDLPLEMNKFPSPFRRSQVRSLGGGALCRGLVGLSPHWQHQASRSSQAAVLSSPHPKAPGFVGSSHTTHDRLLQRERQFPSLVFLGKVLFSF